MAGRVSAPVVGGVKAEGVPLNLNEKPSFFELNAADHLFAGLRPAFRDFARILANHRPRLRFVHDWADEVYTVLMLVLEYDSLNRFGCLFAEEFYALRRGTAKSPGSKLPLRAKRLALLLFVVGGYVEAKLERLHDDVTMELDNRPGAELRWPRSRGEIRRFLKRLYARVYPWLHLSLRLSSFLALVAYLANKSPYHSLYNHALAQIIRRLSMSDVIGMRNKASKKTAKEAAKAARKAGVFVWFWGVLKSLCTLASLAAFIRISVKSFLFGFRGLEWFFQEEGRLIRSDPLPVPPPPPSVDASTDGCQPEGLKDFNRCPMCKKTIENPAIVNSGFLFCYRCIFPHVQRHHSCPVTLTPVTTVRRVFRN